MYPLQTRGGVQNFTFIKGQAWLANKLKNEILK